MNEADIRNRIATVVLVKQATPHEAADRILELVRGAMLSDNVVAEASVQIDDSWDVPEHALMETARLTIETALDIAGITKEGTSDE